MQYGTLRTLTVGTRHRLNRSRSCAHVPLLRFAFSGIHSRTVNEQVKLLSETEFTRGSCSVQISLNQSRENLKRSIRIVNEFSHRHQSGIPMEATVPARLREKLLITWGIYNLLCSSQWGSAEVSESGDQNAFAAYAKRRFQPHRDSTDMG